VRVEGNAKDEEDDLEVGDEDGGQGRGGWRRKVNKTSYLQSKTEVFEGGWHPTMGSSCWATLWIRCLIDEKGVDEGSCTDVPVGQA
jgi:hypothetical protein